MKQVFSAPLAVLAIAALAAGCSSTGTKSVDYKSTSGKPASTTALEVPPELSNPAIDDRFAVPDPKAQTTFSTYNRDRSAGPVVPAGAGVLPAVDGVRMERGGDQRWLVVKSTPDKLWPVLIEFWNENGFTMRRDNPDIGIMETDWAENRAKLDMDWLRRTIGRVMDETWSTGQRDKFRTRLEKGAEPGTTEIYVSHRGVEEIYTSMQQDRTVWQARPADRELEAEFLNKIVNKLGYDDKKVTAAAGLTMPGKPGATAAAGGPSSVAQVAQANAVLQNNGAGPLVVNDGFDRAWRRVGLALDRVGFTVEDRDRSKGVFFVRYIDPEVDLKTGEKQGFMDKLAFWKPAPKAAQPQYRILVADSGANLSQVQVESSAGVVENSSTGKKILALLFEQLK